MTGGLVDFHFVCFQMAACVFLVTMVTVAINNAQLVGMVTNVNNSVSVRMRLSVTMLMAVVIVYLDTQGNYVKIVSQGSNKLWKLWKITKKFHAQGTKIFKYCTCPAGDLQLSLILQTHAHVL